MKIISYSPQRLKVPSKAKGSDETLKVSDNQCYCNL